MHYLTLWSVRSRHKRTNVPTVPPGQFQQSLILAQAADCRLDRPPRILTTSCSRLRGSPQPITASAHPIFGLHMPRFQSPHAPFLASTHPVGCMEAENGARRDGDRLEQLVVGIPGGRSNDNQLLMLNQAALKLTRLFAVCCKEAHCWEAEAEGWGPLGGRGFGNIRCIRHIEFPSTLGRGEGPTILIWALPCIVQASKPSPSLAREFLASTQPKGRIWSPMAVIYLRPCPFPTHPHFLLCIKIAVVACNPHTSCVSLGFFSFHSCQEETTFHNVLRDCKTLPHKTGRFAAQAHPPTEKDDKKQKHPPPSKYGPTIAKDKRIDLNTSRDRYWCTARMARACSGEGLGTIDQMKTDQVRSQQELKPKKNGCRNWVCLARRRTRRGTIAIFQYLGGSHQKEGVNLFTKAPEEQRRNVLTVRTINQWNSLPPEVGAAPSQEAFKKRLEGHLSGPGGNDVEFPAESLPTQLSYNTLAMNHQITRVENRPSTLQILL
ncbi:hypothetical protein L345_09446, partial [Ophiophagus hannah]